MKAREPGCMAGTEGEEGQHQAQGTATHGLGALQGTHRLYVSTLAPGASTSSASFSYTFLRLA